MIVAENYSSSNKSLKQFNYSYCFKNMYLLSLSTPRQIITKLKKLYPLLTLFYTNKIKIIYTFVALLKVFFNKKISQKN